MIDNYFIFFILLSGLAAINFHATTKGNDSKTLLKNLNGKLLYEIKAGMLEGIDFKYLFEKVLNFNHQLFLTNQNIIVATQQTLFRQLTGSATITNGVAKTNDLLVSANLFNAKVVGTVDLSTKILNFQLMIHPINKRLSLVIPMWIEGTLSHPRVSVDAATINKFILREKLEKLKKKIEEKIPLPKKAEQFINRLLRQ